jgi:hypothetical protein
VAVSTQGLQISRVIVPAVTVYVVYIQLTAMSRNKPAMLTGILLVYGVWILVLLDVSFINSLATIATSGSCVLFIADLYLGWTTNRADCSAIYFIYFR